ncbi:putative membrane protein [Bathymodiolus japonicus methanotrophic gill symbiont]|uniref:cytochrome c oxidase assembly protein n=1 Tax=Bathymodiolus japonicus methanotrophic gill symbiont TaxID=113269 RepID=UPI001B71FE90|nr:cytochrome c oxidase assembly protein [Bathymodiolus japonicus methanotrophic gill symbiont]GFO72652.1 putative membrane protein [Bathymodiolus japonicus methanotrophic gill symbiont]
MSYTSVKSLTALCLLLFPLLSLAHGTIRLWQSIWSAWIFTPDVAIPMLLTVVVFFRGRAKRREAGRPVSIGQTISFLLGMLCFVIALQSPLEPLSEHFLFFHQIEHLLMRGLGPLLLILSMPLAPLIQGLPKVVRHSILTPIIRNKVIQWLYNFLNYPVIASVLFIATLLIWQIPSLHNSALADQSLHNWMHFTMILTGFFFWWLICDPRQKSSRIPFGIRIIILWLVTIPNTIIGAIITLKRDQIYAAYDVLDGRLAIEIMLDQQLGGIMIWGPGGMIGLIGTAVVFFLWTRKDKKLRYH